jgi:hypothetical protein
MLEEARPEQLQAVLPAPRGGHGLLEYMQGEIIIVIDKQPQTQQQLAGHSGPLWTGVNSQGRVGLFPPSHMVAFLGTLPGTGTVPPWSTAPALTGGESQSSQYQSVGMFQRSSLRGSKDRHQSGSRRKISRDMISGPTGQVQHTGHIGPDGCFFGDVTFMSTGNGTNGQLSTTSATVLSSSCSSVGGRLPSTGSDNGLSSLSRADSDVSDSAPLLSSGGGSRVAQERPPSQPRMGHAIGYLRQVFYFCNSTALFVSC